ncbi:M16 family metallopeptidase [Candidatus Neomarinimicrobiota bacterium]
MTRIHMRQSIFHVILVVAVVAGGFLQAQQPDRSGPPELGPPPSLTLPPIQYLKLDNGLKILLMEKHDVPLVQLNLVVMAGSGMDPAGKIGLATMTADMLDEGAGSRDALELADAIDFLGADISTGAGRHTTVVSLNTPIAQLDAALPLMADVTLRPTFPAHELERKQKARLTALMQWHDQPNTIASVQFIRALYDEKHPYGRTTSGDESSINALSTKDLKKFHKAHFLPNSASLIVAGDVTAESILPKLEMALGKWKSKKVPAANWPEIGQVEGPVIYLVDKPESPQSVIYMGRVGVSRYTEDFYSIVIMNTILGGAFTSRINMNLREEHGFTYGAYSSFSFRPFPGPFLANSSVQTEVTDQAITEFLNELRGIQEPVPEAELNKARNSVALSYPESFQTISAIAGQLNNVAIYGLPDDYFNTYTERMLAVSVDDVNRVAREYIDPENLAIVVVGDKEKIEEGLKALEYGPVKVLSISDVLGDMPEIPIEE